MSKIGNFESIDNPESGRLSKNLDAPSIPNENDKKKLDTSQPIHQFDRKTPSDIKDMSDREKIAYYRKNGMDSLADNRNAIMRGNEGNGENQRLTKLNSHNYDKLAQARGLDPKSANDTKESFAKWSPDARTASENSDESLRNHSVLTRHAPEGEKAKITENKSGNGISPSGVYVAKGFPETADKRQEDFALPPSNKAETVRSVELARPQNIMVGQAGPQKQFESGEGGISKNGGGRQIVTDGGFKGRDVNRDGSKEPALRYVESKRNVADPENSEIKSFKEESPDNKKKPEVKNKWSEGNVQPLPKYDQAVEKVSCINENLEGTKHPETGVPYERKQVEVDGKKVEGVFPQFKSEFDAKLPKELYKDSDFKQFSNCTEQLKEAVQKDPELAEKFDKHQYNQIMDGSPRISGYRWHHAENPGEMQLVDADKHDATRHTGGRNIWGGGTENR